MGLVIAPYLPPSSAHHTKSVSTMDTDVRASNIDDQSENILVKTDTVPDIVVKSDTVPDIIVKTDTAITSTSDLQDAIFSLWKDYSTLYNFSLWVIRNSLDNSRNTNAWIM